MDNNHAVHNLACIKYAQIALKTPAQGKLPLISALILFYFSGLI